MTTRRVNATMCAFVALSTGVAANVIFLQRGSGANGAVRGTVEPVSSGADPEARREIPANPPDGTLVSRPSSPVLGFSGHAGIPIGATAETSLSPRSDGDRHMVEGRVDLVRAVQRELGRRGYSPGIPNGVVNPATRGAVMAYQRDHGLPVTGEASEALLKAIVFESSGAVRAPGNAISAEQGKPRNADSPDGAIVIVGARVH
jgi:hypothetical protein